MSQSKKPPPCLKKVTKNCTPIEEVLHDRALVIAKAIVSHKLIPVNVPSYLKELLLDYYKSTATTKDVAYSCENPKPTLKLKENKTTPLEETLLNCDYNRFDFMRYTKERIYDRGMGHWDLWNADEAEGRDIYQTKDNMFARNPAMDVSNTKIAAIDFGTKSTVVVVKGNSEHKEPLRIGTTELMSNATQEQYENPTIMEFIDLENFVKSFGEKVGRPNTLFKDVVVANTARENMKSNATNKNKHYTFFTDLKQWADGQKTVLNIGDSKKNYTLKAFADVSEEDLNPIVYYAYYVGLNINNMHRGICLDYLLSYPVTYEKEICEKIRKSFEIGLKKSLPESIVQNETLMKKFRVRMIASEPASYAICALQEYGFDPEDDEKYIYGVFDFGGGTSDYDYGIWENEPKDYDRYDYRVTRFQSQGNRYLGGENILELLTYTIYVDNFETFRKNQIPFTKPILDEAFNC